MTGERHMNPRALLHYFQPLQEWLLRDNIRDQDGIGWGNSWTLLNGQTIDLFPCMYITIYTFVCLMS